MKVEWLSLRCSHHLPSACHIEIHFRTCKIDDNFQSCLEQFVEVLSIYQKGHIVFVGDFNASLSEKRGNAQDALLQHFLLPKQNRKREVENILFNKIVQ